MDRSDNSTSEGSNAIKAKVIVLGEPKTGKSQLIQNLDVRHQHPMDGGNSTPNADKDGLFTIIEFSKEELENTENVCLKTWEHYVGISIQEEELACRGALICIITLNICDSSTANAAFNKWLTLKEEYMAECFLFVIGTHLDESLHRTVQIKDVCTACAENDATYIELSNVDGTNVELLRRLIRQRIVYMLRMRDQMASEHDLTHATNSVVNYYIAEQAPSVSASSEYAEEGKSDGSETGDISAIPVIIPPPPPRPGSVAIPVFEQNILCNSVGSILASYLGAECWPGFEAEEERLVALGVQMSAFVDLLARETGGEFSGEFDEQRVAALTSGMVVDESFYGFDRLAAGDAQRKAAKSGKPAGEESGGNPAELYVDAGYSFAELKGAFEVMGLSLPKSLSLVSAAVQESGAYLVDDPLAGDADQDQAGTPRRKGMSYLRKMMVRLPDGSSADMVLDLESNIEQQIELFLLSNSMADDQPARDKLVQTIYRIREEYYRAHSIQQPPQTHRLGAGENGHGSDGEEQHLASSGSKTNLNDAMSREFSSPVGLGSSRHLNSDGDSHSHSSSNHSIARATRSMSVVSTGGPTQSYKPFAKFKATKKCKLRIALPGGAIEVVLQKGDDLSDSAELIRAKYRLSADIRQKVYEQLIQAFALN